MAPRTFRVVSGKHIAWTGSEFKGVVSARMDDDTVQNVTCGLWPIAFEFVVPGLEFTATLQRSDHPSYGLQFSARSDIKIADGRYALNIVAMKKKLTPTLSKRLTLLVSRFGPSVFDKFEGVLTESVAAESLLGGSPKVTLDHVRELVRTYETTKHAVLFTETFPPFDTQMALKYADILDVGDVRKDPYVLFWRKPKGRVEQDPLHVADAITKEYLGHPAPPNDPRRMAAYFEAAIKQLQRSFKEETNGSIWFSPDLITTTMMSLQPDDDASWNFDASMLTAMFASPPDFMSEDEGLFARAKDDCVERSLAKRLIGLRRRRDNINMSALRCLLLFSTLHEEVCDAHNIPHELDASFPSWRAVYDLYTKCDVYQRSTLRLLVENGIIILMGGAGTGKSTTLGLIIRFACAILNVKMKACALTGKAVDRLKSLCSDDVDCRTLHSQAACTENDPAEAVAIDEASMAFPSIVDKIIGANLSYLVICGDDKQLPSIDAGAFLRDVVATNCFPTVRLEHVYRTGNGSGIATETPRIFGIGEAQLPVAPIDVNGFQIILDNNLENAVQTFGRIVRNGAPDDIIMISNTRRTCKDANRELQPLWNTSMSDPLTLRLIRGQGKAPWVVGDRIISNENMNVEDGQRIFNGMLGRVTGMDVVKKKLVVRFRDIVHTFDAGETAIDHAYCVTTWKFQGSEIKHAIVFFESTWGLSCELLYTAATRGQISTSMYLSENDLKRGLATRIGPKRVTRLIKRIQSAARKRERRHDDDDDGYDDDDA